MNTKIFNFSIFILLLIYSQSYYIQEGVNPNTIITNFTFGSNYYGRYLKEENIFQKIVSHNPNLWIWLGNAVYLDEPNFNYFTNTRQSMDWDFIKYLYEKVKNNEYYKELNEKVPIIGTWGDEEYGISNGDNENNFKEGYKQYYLDFLEADTLDQRRNYVDMGLYSTYSFGYGYQTVRFILLDLKYNQTSYLKKNDTYDMLGERQWNWLENIFKNSKETYTFICMPNQILPNDRYIIKKWYSESRKRLFDLIGKYKRNGVIFLSGGLGFAQILKTFCPLPSVGYNLYECTSSGLSHSNKFTSFINNFYHNDYLVEGTNFNDINFGEVKINWGENNIQNSYIELEIFDKDDKLASHVRINYTDLIYKNDTKDFYLDENNMKDIRYMNVYDGLSCEREIYHRVRTPYMKFRYYLTHFSQMYIALISSVVIILFFELLFRKHILVIAAVVIISFLIYYISYLFDLMNYYNFKKTIQNNN
jgi:alkaline phosphatase D